MGNSLSVRLSKTFQTTSEESWMARVKQNARAFFELRRAALAHGGGGAFDLLEDRPVPGMRRRQAGSLVVHAVAIWMMLWMGGRAVQRVPRIPGIFVDSGLLHYRPPEVLRQAEKTDLGKGAGGDKGVLPPNVGNLARQSAMVLLHPKLPDQQEHTMPVEPTVFGAEERRRVNELGLPWMKEKTNSNGTNGIEGLGDKPGHSMGSSKDGIGGVELGVNYQAGAYPVTCVYCPDPEYTDEARHEKLQGSVTMRVLVTTDGRAGQIRMVKGLGLGLDERAVEKVRMWRFQPARDANKNAIAQWVTVEATYRLF